jgi:thiol-disulfide isomerase/thioredoxin
MKKFVIIWFLFCVLFNYQLLSNNLIILNIDSSLIESKELTHINFINNYQSCCSFEDKDKILPLKFEQNKYSYSIEFELSNTQFLYLETYPLEQSQKILVPPYDTIKIFIKRNPDMLALDYSIQYSERAMKYKNIFDEIIDYLPVIYYQKLFKDIKSNTYSVIIDSLKIRRKNKQQFIDTIILRNNITDNSIIQIFKDIETSENDFLNIYYFYLYYRSDSISEALYDKYFVNWLSKDIISNFEIDKKYNSQAIGLIKRIIFTNYKKSSKKGDAFNLEVKLEILNKNFTGAVLKEFLLQTIEEEILFSENNKVDTGQINKQIRKYEPIIDFKNKKYFENIITLKGVLKIGNKLPTFLFNDRNDKIFSSDYFNQGYYYLLFWATWCGPCVEHLKSINEFSQIIKKYNIHLILISLDSRKTQWLSFVENKLSNFENYLSLGGDQSNAGKSLGINGIPLSILINKEGIIMDISSFFPGDNDLENSLQEVLKK